MLPTLSIFLAALTFLGFFLFCAEPRVEPGMTMVAMIVSLLGASSLYLFSSYDPQGKILAWTTMPSAFAYVLLPIFAIKEIDPEERWSAGLTSFVGTLTLGTSLSHVI